MESRTPSEQSSSPTHNPDTAVEPQKNKGNCLTLPAPVGTSGAAASSAKETRPKAGTNAERVSQMLKQSLALSLLRVGMECGEETAEKIIEVLHDDFFDFKDFQRHVTSLKKCEEIVNKFVRNS